MTALVRLRDVDNSGNGCRIIDIVAVYFLLLLITAAESKGFGGGITVPKLTEAQPVLGRSTKEKAKT
ncbi:hypothetical protein [Mycobacterium sp. ITM-2016-00318]|uniref:hypothetical protein n=1 Tax=Mycobacterium sp. ITM-2016-00318 TaxID=2099693 RepID=UPI001159F3D5|nr:hypothetical protein [Mycobacterium sp. ITM-2016-00318]WNG92587.1 hypothetical protein C6A82_024925 [Mycobacterium sp. ITM-2016-00318]